MKIEGGNKGEKELNRMRKRKKKNNN